MIEQNHSYEIGPAESFIGKIIVNGQSKGVVIPYEIMEANGWDTTTKLKVWVKQIIPVKKGDE